MLMWQCDPELDSVKDQSLRGGDLGMLNPLARGHQVQFARNHQSVSSGGVTVVDGSLKEPTHGLQSSVRMRGHDHSTRIINQVGAIVVQKTPGTNSGAIPVWQGPTNRDRPYTPEWNLPRGNNLYP